MEIAIALAQLMIFCALAFLAYRGVKRLRKRFTIGDAEQSQPAPPPPPPSPSTPSSPTGAPQRCPLQISADGTHRVVYATRLEAQDAAVGEAKAYKCPDSDHWHVSRDRPAWAEPEVGHPSAGRQPDTWSRPTPRPRHASTTALPRCRAHHNKIEFPTQEAAQRWIESTQRRHRAGKWTGAPMDHAYKCPVLFANHWHVSSKPRRPW
jgi:hypothetical protein